MLARGAGLVPHGCHAAAAAEPKICRFGGGDTRGGGGDNFGTGGSGGDIDGGGGGGGGAIDVPATVNLASGALACFSPPAADLDALNGTVGFVNLSVSLNNGRDFTAPLRYVRSLCARMSLYVRSSLDKAVCPWSLFLSTPPHSHLPGTVTIVFRCFRRSFSPNHTSPCTPPRYGYDRLPVVPALSPSLGPVSGGTVVSALSSGLGAVSTLVCGFGAVQVIVIGMICTRGRIRGGGGVGELGAAVSMRCPRSRVAFAPCRLGARRRGGAKVGVRLEAVLRVNQRPW